MIQIQIHIVQIFHIGQWIINENVIHIEGMLWRLQSTVFQHLCAVNDGVHQNILSQMKMLCILPGEHLILRKYICITDRFLMFCALLIVNVVTEHHIYILSLSYQFGKFIQHFRIIFLVQPVITVYNLEIEAGCMFKTGVDRLAMSSIFLMDCLYDSRIFCCILISNLSRTVFGRSIIYNDDLHFVSARKQGFDTVSHISF